MRKLSFLAAAASAALCLASCEPEVLSMLVDMRQPSQSGLDLSGKTISVVYLDDLSGRDTVFNAMVAEGFAKALEEDYFAGSEAVNIYRMEKDMAGDYSSKDTLVKAAVMSGDDVIFMFDSPTFGEMKISSKSDVANAAEPDVKLARVSAPFSLNLYAYNTMGDDVVAVYKGTSSVNQPVFCREGDSDEDIQYALWGALGEAGEATGTKSAAKFLSSWKEESFYFYHYDYDQSWVNATVAASQYKWHDAIDAWMETLLHTKNMGKRGAAEYDIAVAFYLLGDYNMSQMWLTQSQSDCELPLAGVLQRKLIDKTGKMSVEKK